MKNIKKNKTQNNLDLKSLLGGKNTNPFVILLIALIAWSVLSVAFQSNVKTKDISINDALNYARNGEINTVEIDGSVLNIELKNGEKFTANKEPQLSFYELLDISQIDPNLISGGIYDKQSYPWFDIISGIAFPIVSIGLIWWIFRQAGRSSGGLFSIGKSKAKLFSKDSAHQIRFNYFARSSEIKN